MKVHTYTYYYISEFVFWGRLTIILLLSVNCLISLKATTIYDIIKTY